MKYLLLVYSDEKKLETVSDNECLASSETLKKLKTQEKKHGRTKR